MQNLHNDMNRMAKQEDPIKKIVEKLTKEADVLCFDEFFVEAVSYTHLTLPTICSV